MIKRGNQDQSIIKIIWKNVVFCDSFSKNAFLWIKDIKFLIYLYHQLIWGRWIWLTYSKLIQSCGDSYSFIILTFIIPIHNYHVSISIYLVHPCKIYNGGCSDTCMPLGSEHLCLCPKDFVLTEDQRTCEESKWKIRSELML